MPCIYLVYAALASRTADQIFSPNIRKTLEILPFTDYIQKRDQKSEILELIRKNVTGEKRQFQYVLLREKPWFDSMLNDQNIEQHWRSDSRMSQETFRDIVRVVQPSLEKRDTQFRRAIPIEKRTAMVLWRLSTGNFFRTVANTFAVGKSTAIQITREFCSKMLRLAPRYIHFPRSRRERAEAIEQFKVFCQCRIPQVIGALDGTHIPIVSGT